jgi:transposase
MFSEIHQLRQIGLKKAQVARKLEIDVKTVSKYWDKNPDEFAEERQEGKKRTKKLAQYRDIILKWLQEHPDISSSQILDWLKEHYHDFSVKERTLRRYVHNLRQKHDLPKPVLTRQYQAVAELPPGRQLQVDFGQKKVANHHGGHTTLYVMGAVLAHSRYKYGQWTDKPISSAGFVKMLKDCFAYLGGVPKEIVLDQDKLVAVSENYGDIIYTYEFEKFKQAVGFNVYLCRKSDPESKGKVEAVVKYFKNNFAKNRLLGDINFWNQSFWEWLERTGNQSLHGTTKKIPAQVFLEEQQYLKPAPTINITEEIVTRTIRKDNTVLYKSNRYSVPLGTYRPEMELKIAEQNGHIIIRDLENDQVIAEHPLCTERGKLIQNNNHCRDHSAKIEELYRHTLELLGSNEEAAALLTGIRREKPRYVRDQYHLLGKLAQETTVEVMKQALIYCLERELYSAVDCRDVVLWLNKATPQEVEYSTLSETPSWLKVKTEKRDVGTAYAHLAGGEV